MANTKEPKKLIIVDGESKYSLDLSNSGGSADTGLKEFAGFINQSKNTVTFYDKIETDVLSQLGSFVLKSGDVRFDKTVIYKLHDYENIFDLFFIDAMGNVCMFEDKIELDGDVEYRVVGKLGGGSTEIDLSDYAKKTDLPKIWKGTQSQYDALGTYDAGTLYFVIEEKSGGLNPQPERD